jgi:hypothetical protein
MPLGMIVSRSPLLTSPHPFSLFLLLFILVSPVVASFPLRPPSFRAISLNANGLADPMKLDVINSMVHKVKPHVVVIQETQSAQPVASRLRFPGYDFYENPGFPVGNGSLAKWGILIAICRVFLTAQQIATPPCLQGRAVVLNLTIPLTAGQAFVHRFMGIYAPWDPGTPANQNDLFWPSLAELCHSAKGSWSLTGDCNATLLSTESTATPYRISSAQLAYANFLQMTGSIDHWLTIPDHSVRSDFTYSRVLICDSFPNQLGWSIIDRAASSRLGSAAVTIEALRFFVPCTDHRPILAATTLTPPHPILMEYLFCQMTSPLPFIPLGSVIHHVQKHFASLTSPPSSTVFLIVALIFLP